MTESRPLSSGPGSYAVRFHVIVMRIHRLYWCAGKTHTTVGDLRDPANAGIIPRAVSDLFEQLRTRGGPFKVSVSFLEVYNEQLMDLLIPPEATRPLRLVEDPERGVVCQNLTEVSPCPPPPLSTLQT